MIACFDPRAEARSAGVGLGILSGVGLVLLVARVGDAGEERIKFDGSFDRAIACDVDAGVLEYAGRPNPPKSFISTV